MTACRTCLKILNNENDWRLLDDRTEHFTTFRSILSAFLPELNLNVFRQSVICISCSEVINLSYEFRTKCLKTEKKINDRKLSMECNNLVLVDILDVVQEDEVKIDVKPILVEVPGPSVITVDHLLPLPSDTNEILSVGPEPSTAVYLLTDDNIKQEFLDESDALVEITSTDETSQSEAETDQIKVETFGPSETEHLEVPKKQFNCNICKETFFRKSLLKNHILDHLGIDRFQCNVCHEKFKRITRLKEHLKVHIGKKSICCHTCKSNFNNEAELDEHREKCIKNRLFRCNVCQKGFKYKNNLKTHLLDHINQKSYKCDICQITLKSKHCFKKHLDFHKQNNFYHCEVCNQNFITRQNLKLHMMNHTGERPFKCSVCQHGFKTRRDMELHGKIHTGEKPFKCEHCDRSYITKQRLKLHSEIHNGEPVSCPICKKVLRLRHKLKRHILTHSMEKPFNCDACDKSFKTKFILKKHFVLKHSVVEVKTE